MLPWAVGPLFNRAPQYQNQYTLVNRDGKLGVSALSRRVLALPPEVLAEIFFFCLPFDEDLLVTPDPGSAPLVLCAVCRQWRSVALSTPKLWSSIVFESDLVDIGISTPESAALYVDFCHEWLSRARSAPLSLQLYNCAANPAAVNSLLEIISGLSQQWQNIEIGGDLPSSHPVDGKYPFLEKLNIFSPPDDHPILSFHHAPRLRDVFIPVEYTTRLQLPWHQLTKFGTEKMGIEACLDLFRHAPNLAEAYLRIAPYGASALPDTIFSLPQLKSLNLGGAWADDDDDDDVEVGEIMPMTLLNCLKAPALKTLALGFEHVRTRNVIDMSPFLSFVSQSAFHLDALTLSCLPITMEALVECLKATPSVIHLKLLIPNRVINMNPVFAAFTGHQDFLPKLQSLDLRLLASSPTIDGSVVVDMLIWRCLTSEVACLQSFLFSYKSRYIENHIKPFVTAHPVYPKLEASGANLCLERTRFLRFRHPFMDILY
ncbi:hypothetical protein DFH08DRAFT_1087834 [Mycena albidolilacea]|uniref:F-box domain-containing protein n=1 Tax=Mycena albidolilacea TaxID=1033008 RepID=A0AAD6Z8M7_9AGAR|nr:hypothetical protein DFH08DRAFT_1087834 [Mycena albidolilacea]